jgi:hypothetical protein
MGRRDFQYNRIILSRGTHEDQDSAPLNTCADTRNVWAPNGKVETRPGYRGMSVGSWTSGTYEVPFSTVRWESNAGGPPPTYTAPSLNMLDIGNMTSGADRLYLGYATKWSIMEIFPIAGQENATTMRFWAEYYNGSEWLSVPLESGLTPLFGSTGLATNFEIVPPADWATTSIDSVTAYWVRLNLNGANPTFATTLDLGFVSGVTVYDAPEDSSVVAKHIYFGELSFDTGNFALEVTAGTGSASIAQLRHSLFPGPEKGYLVDPITGFWGNFVPDEFETGSIEVGNVAVVPQFREAFMASEGSNILRINGDETPQSGSDVFTMATVEDRDFAVGPGAPYDPGFIQIESDFPRAKYIDFFDGRLWFSGIKDNPYTIRWGAKAPYHKVIPSISFEVLAEDDNSPITAIAGLGEHMVVFKRDSIWIMIPIGENPLTGTESFEPKRVVAGVGCVSQQTVQQIRGELIFLSDDGIYAFNGTPAIRKVTEDARGADRLIETMGKVSPVRSKFASAVNWKRESYYIMSFSSGGIPNDVTVAWDYATDTWWVWDNIDAQLWAKAENNEIEHIFFADSYGQVFLFGSGKTDHGATITSHVKTQRIGYDGYAKRSLRTVRPLSDNKTEALTVYVSSNDNTEVSQNIDLTDTNEKDWGELSWASGASTDDNWETTRRRVRRADFWEVGDWAQIRIEHSTKGQGMSLSGVDVGFVPLGKR